MARADRGSASALYFTTYYGAGALGAYVPGLAWETWGWGGVATVGLVTLAVAAKLRAALASAGFTVVSTREADNPDPIATDQRVWPLVERTMTTQKDYPVVLYDEV